MQNSSDFSKGSISGNILRLAVPMTLAQLINVLYNVVDRIYIGHIPHTSTEALTGIGLTLPVITIITAFANLFGMGGAPLFSIARGSGDEKRPKRSCKLLFHAPDQRDSPGSSLLYIPAPPHVSVRRQ